MNAPRKHGTGIAWTFRPGYKGETWNPLRARNKATGQVGWACVKVSPACHSCYAAELNETMRWGRGTGLPYTVGAREDVELFLDVGTLLQPLRWTDPRCAFVCSMTDLHWDQWPAEWIRLVYAVMILAQRHRFLTLTKRAEEMCKFRNALNPSDAIAELYVTYPEAARYQPLTKELAMTVARSPLDHVEAGVSAETQAYWNERVRWLLLTRAKRRFVSFEPALETVDIAQPVDLLASEVNRLRGKARDRAVAELHGAAINQVLIGGESGRGHRVLDLEVLESAHRQTIKHGVALFVKQDSGQRPGMQGRIPDHLWARKEFPE